MKVILADLQIQVVNAWRQAFQEYHNIEIHHGSIFDVSCHAIVSPANSFGFMDGGIDMAISRHFGWHVQERVQEVIRNKHHGELLVGDADIVATDDAKIPYVIAAPTMRVPMILEHTSVNIYLATRAVLLLMKFGTFSDGTVINTVVQQVAIPGMGTGVGRFPPAICAKQMKQAVDDILLDQHEFPTTWSQAQERHQLLYGEDYRDLQY
ncbi:MAG: macro domain-containing protein [Anaerolineae bacterium]|nr:macro domain-containing protein [Anaerolineae bacterium]